MIIWQGFGFIVPLATFCCLLFTEIISEAVTGDDQFFQNHESMRSVGFSSAAILLLFLNRLIAKKKTRYLVDLETGEPVVVDDSGSFFFIPNRWWPALLIALAAVGPFLPEPPPRRNRNAMMTPIHSHETALTRNGPTQLDGPFSYSPGLA